MTRRIHIKLDPSKNQAWAEPIEANVIPRCNDCGRENTSRSNPVMIEGEVWLNCPSGRGHNAEKPATWSAYFAGSIFYDLPFLFLATIALLGAHAILSPYGTRWETVLVERVTYIVIALVFGEALPLGLITIGSAPAFITMIVTPAIAAWLIR